MRGGGGAGAGQGRYNNNGAGACLFLCTCEIRNSDELSEHRSPISGGQGPFSPCSGSCKLCASCSRTHAQLPARCLGLGGGALPPCKSPLGLTSHLYPPEFPTVRADRFRQGTGTCGAPTLPSSRTLSHSDTDGFS